MWAQIGDERVTEIPPDGLTPVDIYVGFSFSGEDVPEGTVVNFLIGKLKNDSLEDQNNDEVAVIKKWTVDEIKGRVIGIQNVELTNYEAKIVNTVTRSPSGALEIKPVAKTTIKPIGDVLKDYVNVVAYCSYDKLKQVERLIPDSIALSVSQDSGQFLATVDRYSISLNIWDTPDSIPPMPTSRTGCIAEFVNGKMYAIGGFAENFLAINEEYDPSTKKWTPKASLPTARAYASSFVYNNQIYIFGGMNFSTRRISSLAYKYNPVGDYWTTLPEMPVGVAFGTVQIVSGKAYVIGGVSRMTTTTGENGENEIEKIDQFNLGVFSFDLTSETWSIEIPSLASYPVTTLSQNVSTSRQIIAVNAANLPPYGLLLVNELGATEEIIPYEGYDGQSTFIKLTKGLQFDHSVGEPVKIINLPENRMGLNSRVNGNDILLFNGKTFYGYNSSSDSFFATTVRRFSTTAKTFIVDPPSPNVPRYKAADVLYGSLTFALGGSNEVSEWQNKLETFDGTTFIGPPTYAKMPQSRTGLGAAIDGDYIYVLGGNGSGHAAGWLQIESEATPNKVRADGRATASVTITAKDDAGDPPPDGTKFLARGIIYISQDADQTDQTNTEKVQPSPNPRISILPVLFSSQEMVMQDGTASTSLLPRSEDPIKQVDQLSLFASEQETAQQTISEVANYQRADEPRELYSAAIEITVVDDYYFGSSNTDSTIAGSTGTQTAQSSFAFSPSIIEQGLSSSVSFFSDIVSVPDITVLSDDPVEAVEAKKLIDSTREEVPFGASPYYDAMYLATDLFSKTYNPLFPEKGLVIATIDNDESFSAYSPEDIIEVANSISGPRTFPIFATSFVITDPISLSARRARTDVADLEKISFNTGGNSFSVIDSSYKSFVINRIKSSAPASFGSGAIIGTHLIDGFLSAVSYSVDNLISGNSAEMILSYSVDGYNFTSVPTTIPPNVSFSLGNPVKVKIVKYEIILRTNNFDSPILESATLNYSQPNVQFLFTYPRQISGQISELASVENSRLPVGGVAESSFAHGESFMFDRDYATITQPAVRERGTIFAINRSIDAIVENSSTADILRTEDYFVYKSITGNWAQNSTIRVFVGGEEVGNDQYIKVPEKGIIAFRQKMRPQDVVTVEVTLPSVFRYGMKITNPSTEEVGYLDSFGYEFGTTQDQYGGAINRPPRAVNLFITPSPVQKGGPMTANYTFVDPEGDDEDTAQTKIDWYRNGAIVPEISNLKRVSNSNFRASRSDSGENYGIAFGQEWYFIVTPSDGKAFGPPSRSPKIIVAATPPTVSNVYLSSSNEDNTIFSSSDTISVQYEYNSLDEEDEKNTIFTWYVNGLEVKTGTVSTLGPEDKNEDGEKYVSVDNVIRCEVIPSNGKEYGQLYSSDSITVLASTPVVEDVSLIPETPTTLSTLRVTYTFTDPDNLQDKSVIYWYKNGVRMSELDNTNQVPNTLLSPGEEWYVTVTPSNGYVTGTLEKSATAVIEF